MLKFRYIVYHIRVQSIVVAYQDWDLPVKQIASEYGISQARVKSALAFYEAYQQEIDIDLAAEKTIEAEHG